MIFDPEIKTKKLVDPLMLWDHRQPLIQHVFQCVVIGAHYEGAPPQIWTPVTNSLHEPDEAAAVEVTGAEDDMVADTRLLRPRDLRA